MKTLSRQDCITLEGSCSFLKELTTASLSTITFIRGIFPRQAYVDRILNDTRVKLLSENSGIPEVSQFLKLIRSCYDAIEKKYLEQITVGICANSENRLAVLETYNLVFRYNDVECSMTHNNHTVKVPPKEIDAALKASCMMLKNIWAVDGFLTKMPKQPPLTIILQYYDDVTPWSYQPEGFVASSNENFSFSKKPLDFLLGKVNTELHGYRFHLKTALVSNIIQRIPKIIAVSPPPQTNGSHAEMSTTGVVHLNHYFRKRLTPDKVDNRNEFKCPCTCKEERNTVIIKCVRCGKRQHKVCYGMLGHEVVPVNFNCVYCFSGESTSSTPFDAAYTYKGLARQEFCAMRRALLLGSTLKTVTSSDLQKHLGCDESLAKSLMDRLRFEGFITQKGAYARKESEIGIAKPKTSCRYQEYFPKFQQNENLNTERSEAFVTQLKVTPPNTVAHEPASINRECHKRCLSLEVMRTADSDNGHQNTKSKRFSL